MIEKGKSFDVVIGLPAYNEESDLSDLLREIKDVDLDNYVVLVLDDGSTDNTAQIAGQWSEKIPLVLHRHQTNRGLGEALRSICSLSMDLLKEDGHLITIDADRSHRPEQIPELLAKASQGYDFVIASRYTGASRVTGVPAYRRMLSAGTRVLVRILFGIRQIRDFTSGYRAISRELITRAAGTFPRGLDGLVTESGFPATVEILIKCLRIGARPAEIPIDLRYDLKRGSSKIRIIRTVLAYLKLFFRLKLKSVQAPDRPPIG